MRNIRPVDEQVYFLSSEAWLVQLNVQRGLYYVTFLRYKWHTGALSLLTDATCPKGK